eukprot:INCI16227.4.p1 GENE.INCI16227.4~~INCI16227.4.p1  ORF type:complete len:269 (-),score=26.17 INCI16227.4:313-1119(-)
MTDDARRVTCVAVATEEHNDTSVAKRARLSVEPSHRVFVDAPQTQQLQATHRDIYQRSSAAVSRSVPAQCSAPASQSGSTLLTEHRPTESGGSRPTTAPNLGQHRPPVATARLTGPAVSLETANAQLINATLCVRLREHQLRCAKEKGDAQAEALATAQLLGARALMGAAARAKLIASTVESSVARAADSVAQKERQRRIAGREACNKLRERRKVEDAKRIARIRQLERTIAARRSEVAASKNAIQTMRAEVEALTEAITNRMRQSRS